ncbi:IS66 family insertion sequence element accessory protein TnpB [Pseudomonas fragi]|uniref:IS66 family insertion sequence element accessory protein TnpB n=1 Tax=Pseudomonas fragi TaxID=296 RepID=UPI002955D584|nr:IS66 family insertion sequence element accessory protein TnpB [Pseudomonas fragi]WOL29967.1 IS66 family insertion sequence element accessory protein TnpB [Pseudomonas fragi]
MIQPDGKVERVYLYPVHADFRKSIDGLAALVAVDIKMAELDSVHFVFLQAP